MSGPKPPFVAAVLLGATLVGGWLGFRQSDPVRLTFLAVGQGDSIVFQAGGRTVLVDDGPVSGSFDAGGRIVVPKLRALGVRRVDLVLLTHPDLDHVGGTAAVLKTFPEAQIAVSRGFRGDANLAGHFRRWRVAPDRILWLNPHAAATIGSMKVRFECPPHRPADDDNSGSVWTRIEAEGATAVLTGDAPESVEAEEIREADWHAQILKAGHHGSRTSTSWAFLKAVRPEWVVVSCGRDNRYGHPARETVDRITQSGAHLARTDRDGDVTFEAVGGRFVRW